MATYRNLRYCEVLHDGTYYDVMVGVNDLDEVNDVLQEWALANADIGEALDLPEALIKNTDAKEINISAKSLDSFVYVKSASTGYMDAAKNAGIYGTFPTLPKILVGGLYVMPACTAYLWSTATFTGIFSSYNIATANFTLVENEVNYIGIDYASGTPAYTLYTSQSSFNYSSIIPVCAVLYFNSELNVIPMGTAGDGLPEKLLLNQYYRKEFDITTNFTLTEGAQRYVELGALTVSNGVETIECLPVDTETAENDMWLWYRDATSTWQKTQSNQINNTQYQGAGTGLQSLGAGEFVINYIYRVIDDTNLLIFNILSSNFASLALAKDSDMLTDLPDAIKEGAVLVGRMIVEKDSDAPTVQKIQRVNPFATIV
jgi:hypothetical protein